MAVVTGSWVADILLLMVFLLYLLYRNLTSSHGYFQARGIPYLKPYPLLGNFTVQTKTPVDQATFLYNSFPDERFFGFFLLKVPILAMKDPSLIQQILTKDFAHFQDRGFNTSLGDLMSMSMFFQKGDSWRSLRYKLSPTFTSGKLKLMFHQMVKSGDHVIDSIVKSLGKVVDAKAMTHEFVIEVIASTAFGLDFSKNNAETEEFVSKSVRVTKTTFLMKIKFLFILIAPELMKLLKMSILSSDVEEYFLNLTKATKEYRRKNNIKRDDYFQLLLTLQEAEKSGQNLIPSASDNNEEDALINQMDYIPRTRQEKDSKLMTDRCVTAQSLIFLSGGSDSVSTTLMFALYHIAKDPVVQERSAEEVESSLAEHGGWTYQAIKEMAYLDMVLQETLRLYPPNPIGMRECTIPYRIPESDIVLEKGLFLNIPIRGFHMDPKVYPDPEIFNPDRFVDNNFKPNSMYMPFGDGPRICIAMRFAIMEMKIFLAKIVLQYSIDVDRKTKFPFAFDPQSFAPSPMGGIRLNFHKRPQTEYL
uniref:Cytochrome P450 n=1 Tax=Graphocephala atropunctata TaxID=36148 RepID=A0A1B6LA08_9HEMI